jgi:hypothetical protein
VNEQETKIAELFYAAIQKASTHSERGQQAQRFEVGISDLGYCSERVRRMLDQQVPGDTDWLKAFIGTALGDHIEKAVEAHYPGRVLVQQEVKITLQGDEYTYEVPGHPDLILPDEGIVIDAKSSDGLSLARRLGADQQKRFQRHGYGLGAWEAGLFGDIPLKDVQVGNVWIDRTGDEQELHVELEPFSEDVIHDAGQWLDSVVYAYRNGEEAQKEPPREVCAVTCGFFSVCREWQTDVSGVIEDPELLEAIKMYVEGGDLVRQGTKLKDGAKSVLRGISGSDGTHVLRWVKVDESVVPEHTRRGYERLDLKRMKKK